MSLEIKLGGNEMVFWRNKKVEKSDGGPADPSRRLFFKKAKDVGIAAAGTYAALSLGLNASGQSDALAGGDAPYKTPGAIEAESDPTLRSAWFRFHTDKGTNINGKLISGKQFAAQMLRMTSLPGPIVSQETFDTSFGYRLLVAKMPRRYGNYPGMCPAENVSLRHFGSGVSNLFRQQNKSARREFASGIFASANLVEKDYMTMQKLGINAKYDRTATVHANALNLANIFIQGNLDQKENMLRVIADKFQGVKANNNATDWNSMEYQMKGVYWNLGLYISSEFLLKNKEVARRIRGPPDHALYEQLYQRFKYDTCKTALLKVKTG